MNAPRVTRGNRHRLLLGIRQPMSGTYCRVFGSRTVPNWKSQAVTAARRRCGRRTGYRHIGAAPEQRGRRSSSQSRFGRLIPTSRGHNALKYLATGTSL